MVETLRSLALSSASVDILDPSAPSLALQMARTSLQRAGTVSLADLDRWMDHQLGYGGNPSAAGVIVNHHTILQYNPALAAANIIGQDMASMPLNLFERRPDGSKVTSQDPVAYKLAYEPNPMMSSYTWRLVMEAHALWRGNAISVLNWDNSGRLTQLWPIHPDRVKWQVEDSGLWYYVLRKSGEWQQFAAEDVLHIRGLGGDGISGYSLVELLADSLGVPMAARQFAARYFSNDATPGVILKHPQILSPTAQTNIRTSFESTHRGVSNSHVLGIIEEGMDVVQLQVKANEAQLLECLRFGVEDVSRLTRIPLHMLGDLSRSTNNNIEHQGLEYGKFCIRPRATNWEQELNRKLFYGTQKFPEFDLSELYRGDAKSRAESNQIKFQNGVLDIDEWRRDDGRNPLPGGLGKVRIVPLNMQVIAGKEALPEPPQPPALPAPKEGK